MNFISTADVTGKELASILSAATLGKKQGWKPKLKGKTVGLLFFNPSLRTRTSFQAGLIKLGSVPIALSATDSWALELIDGSIMDGSTAEHVKDAARVLSTYLDAICIRSFPGMKDWDDDKKDALIQGFAKHATVPVINMESCLWHPCQALADALTMQEVLGKTKGKTFVLSWANHPRQLPMAVPNSALLIAAQMGMNVRLACPKGYELDSDILNQVKQTAVKQGGSFSTHNDQAEAFKGAQIIYAKSWTPPVLVGKPDEDTKLRKKLSWTITKEKMAMTNNAAFMHCLPVRRNVVVTDEVLDSKQSVIIQQAENRMHSQNALLLKLLGGKSKSK